MERLTYEINKIGTNINQIAWKLNGIGYCEKEAEQEMKIMLILG